MPIWTDDFGSMRPSSERDAKDRAVVDGPLGRAGRPEVRVGVEVDERKGAVLCGAGTQDREAGGMVAAENDRKDAGLDDWSQFVPYVGGGLLDVAGEDVDVAVVDDAQRVERRLEFLRVPVVRSKLTRGVADGAGAEAGAGAVQGRHVHRDADDGDIGTGEVTRWGTAGEGVGAAVAGTALPIRGETAVREFAAGHGRDDSR